MVGSVIFLIVIWSAIGLLISASNFADDVDGFEFMNPFWIYKHRNVNFFGAFVLTIAFNLICPIGSICYWFYKLCTVRRKK